MDAPLFRLAGPADAAPITALIERAYRGPETAGQWDSESHLLRGPRTSIAEIADLLGRADSRFVVAMQAGRMAGCALIQQVAADTDPRFCYFGMFATDPACRAEGLGKAVLAESERLARDIFGARHMVMTVINVRTALIAWYERRGYRLTGVHLPFPFTETSGEARRDFDLAEMRKDFF